MKHELEKQVREGERARQLLEDTILKRAISSMRETIFHNIQTSNWKATDEREELYKQLKAVDQFESELTRIVRGGDIAKSRLKEFFRKLR